MNTEITRHADGSATVTMTFDAPETKALGPDIVAVADIASGLYQGYLMARRATPPTSQASIAAQWSDVLDAVKLGEHHLPYVRAAAIRYGSLEGGLTMSQVAYRLGMGKSTLQYHWEAARGGKDLDKVAWASRTPGAVDQYGHDGRTWRGPVTGWDGRDAWLPQD